MSRPALKHLLEAALLAAAEPLSLDRLLGLFDGDAEGAPSREAVRAALVELAADCEGRAVEVKEVASGFRMQVRAQAAPWVNRLWGERAARYSRALLETLAIIAYRQPVTRGEIEDIRGVAVSSNIIKTLSDREWIRVAGFRDVPGRPAVYATTRQFLDYFNLRSLSELPALAELRDVEELTPDLFGGALAPSGPSELAGGLEEVEQGEEGEEAEDAPFSEAGPGEADLESALEAEREGGEAGEAGQELPAPQVEDAHCSEASPGAADLESAQEADREGGEAGEAGPDTDETSPLPPAGDAL